MVNLPQILLIDMQFAQQAYTFVPNHVAKLHQSDNISNLWEQVS